MKEKKFAIVLSNEVTAYDRWDEKDVVVASKGDRVQVVQVWSDGYVDCQIDSYECYFVVKVENLKFL